MPERFIFIADHRFGSLCRWTVLRISRPTLLEKWPILFRELRITSSGGRLRFGYAKYDGAIIYAVIIRYFVGEDLRVELMISMRGQN
jgi:hypothetical protein